MANKIQAVGLLAFSAYDAVTTAAQLMEQFGSAQEEKLYIYMLVPPCLFSLIALAWELSVNLKFGFSVPPGKKVELVFGRGPSLPNSRVLPSQFFSVFGCDFPKLLVDILKAEPLSSIGMLSAIGGVYGAVKEGFLFMGMIGIAGMKNMAASMNDGGPINMDGAKEILLFLVFVAACGLYVLVAWFRTFVDFVEIPGTTSQMHMYMLYGLYTLVGCFHLVLLPSSFMDLFKYSADEFAEDNAEDSRA